MKRRVNLFGLPGLACGLFASDASAQLRHPCGLDVAAAAPAGADGVAGGMLLAARAPVEGAVVLCVLLALMGVAVFCALKKSSNDNNPDGDTSQEG